jgi:hypothetical protein
MIFSRILSFFFLSLGVILLLYMYMLYPFSRLYYSRMPAMNVSTSWLDSSKRRMNFGLHEMKA